MTEQMERRLPPYQVGTWDSLVGGHPQEAYEPAGGERRGHTPLQWEAWMQARRDAFNAQVATVLAPYGCERVGAVILRRDELAHRAWDAEAVSAALVGMSFAGVDRVHGDPASESYGGPAPEPPIGEPNEPAAVVFWSEGGHPVLAVKISTAPGFLRRWAVMIGVWSQGGPVFHKDAELSWADVVKSAEGYGLRVLRPGVPWGEWDR